MHTKFKYLSEFDAKIKNTGAQVGSFHQTSLKQKISCKCKFKCVVVERAVV
jgi:hypothetical protein